eukprot:1119808-Rhodomonas_salina.2
MTSRPCHTTAVQRRRAWGAPGSPACFRRSVCRLRRRRRHTRARACRTPDALRVRTGQGPARAEGRPRCATHQQSPATAWDFSSWKHRPLRSQDRTSLEAW